jgi:hypothetical protein
LGFSRRYAGPAGWSGADRKPLRIVHRRRPAGHTVSQRPDHGRDVPLFHVLFIPQWDVPERGGFATAGGLGGTSEHLTLDYDYQDVGQTSPGRSVKSQPIHILKGKTLQAPGHTFDLSAGNIFVADVALDGTLRIAQLSPGPQQQDASPASVLAFIKRSLPANERVQQLETSRG